MCSSDLNLKLGYGGTKSEMERLLADAQKISGVEYNIDNLSDVYSAIHVIQGQLDITGTTAKEAATTISGSFNQMKAAAKNVMGEIALGMDVGPALNELANTIITFAVGNLLPFHYGAGADGEMVKRNHVFCRENGRAMRVPMGNLIRHALTGGGG